jgi:hypothetical protein
MNEDIIFDYEKEALIFIQNKVFVGLYESNSTVSLIDYIRDFVKDTSVISKIDIRIDNIEDTSELLLPKIKYAIKNEDIKLLDALLDGLKAAASVNFFQGSPADKTIPAITGVIAALLKFGRDILKGVRLNSKELLLLVILKRDGVSETNELLDKLVSKKITIEEQELLKLLGNLSQKRSLIGTNVSLIAKTSDGRWVTTI